MPERPLVEPHPGPAPEDLLIEDLTVGDGTLAQPGQTAVVHYVGVGVSSGEEFDASWNRGEPFDFRLGAGHVIKGWDEGVVGMRIGGRRRLVIPSRLGYGARGAGGVIAPNETLIFVIDLLELR
ncbi:MAG TPA: FKBP-type peptidyl-prolyl cis-trans isomerase [Acidimicrobiales bacterium]|nr:FKBP-type peptidyl-prolyl cis-trans isomerase [Acidimicrobiales bacterium]